MCGIAGLLDLSGARPPDRSALERMAAPIIHRGPDDDGYFVAPPVGLAARRLSIVDLAGGHMPLSNEDGSVWIVYNGEIYNAPELRADLQARGHIFRTRADTEVIVHAYEQWGTECLTFLRGMFAIALWDARRQRLLLARDRFGVKPLYYALANRCLAFGSEIVPVLEGIGLARSVNIGSLHHLLTYGMAPAPHTLFEGVRSLPPAHYLEINAADDCHMREPYRYWDIHYPTENERGRARREVPEQFLELLRESVRIRLMSDVPIGALLSGGIDSSSLVALLQELSAGRTSTFSIGFEADTHDEAKYAREAAAYLQTDHHVLSFGLSDFARWPDVIRHMESPQCSATSIPIYMLYRACHEAGYKVILTGEGADELLGGYHWFAGDTRVRPWLRLPQAMRARLAPHVPRISSAGRRVLAEGTTDPVARYALWLESTTWGERAALTLPAHRIDVPTHGLPFAHQNPQLDRDDTSFDASHQPLAPFDQFRYLEAHTRLPAFINDEVDRMSMAHSVEARVPFLDHRLWEFVAALPSGYIQSGPLEKQLLRRVMRGHLPASIRLRRKQGLAAPHALFWRQHRVPAFATEAIATDAIKATGYFAPAGVEHLLAEHRAARADHSRALTAVLTTQLWHAEFIQ